MEKPVNVRITDKTAAKLDEAVRISERTKAQLMRQAMEIGLIQLEKVGYDLETWAMNAMLEAKGTGSNSEDFLEEQRREIEEDNDKQRAN